MTSDFEKYVDLWKDITYDLGIVQPSLGGREKKLYLHFGTDSLAHPYTEVTLSRATAPP